MSGLRRIAILVLAAFVLSTITFGHRSEALEYPDLFAFGRKVVSTGARMVNNTINGVQRTYGRAKKKVGQYYDGAVKFLTPVAGMTLGGSAWKATPHQTSNSKPTGNGGGGKTKGGGGKGNGGGGKTNGGGGKGNGGGGKGNGGGGKTNGGGGKGNGGGGKTNGGGGKGNGGGPKKIKTFRKKRDRHRKPKPKTKPDPKPAPDSKKSTVKPPAKISPPPAQAAVSCRVLAANGIPSDEYRHHNQGPAGWTDYLAAHREDLQDLATKLSSASRPGVAVESNQKFNFGAVADAAKAAGFKPTTGSLDSIVSMYLDETQDRVCPKSLPPPIEWCARIAELDESDGDNDYYALYETDVSASVPEQVRGNQKWSAYTCVKESQVECKWAVNHNQVACHQVKLAGPAAEGAAGDDGLGMIVGRAQCHDFAGRKMNEVRITCPAASKDDPCGDATQCFTHADQMQDADEVDRPTSQPRRVTPAGADGSGATPADPGATPPEYLPGPAGPTENGEDGEVVPGQ